MADFTSADAYRRLCVINALRAGASSPVVDGKLATSEDLVSVVPYLRASAAAGNEGPACVALMADHALDVAFTTAQADVATKVKL